MIEDARRRWFREEVLPLEPRLLRAAQRLAHFAGMDAEDLLQDALEKLIVYPRGQAVDNVYAFALTVLKNVARQAARRRRVVPIDALDGVEALEVQDDRPDADRCLQSRDEVNLLFRLVERLPPQCGRVFKLRKIAGLSNGAIAAQLGLSVSTVEKHLIKGLRLCSEGLAAASEVPSQRGQSEAGSENAARADQAGGRRLGGAPGRAAWRR